MKPIRKLWVWSVIISFVCLEAAFSGNIRVLDLAGEYGYPEVAAILEEAEALAPAVVFPMHAYNREFMYGAFAREAAEKKLVSRIICPENKGDRFTFGPHLGQEPPGPAGGRRPAEFLLRQR